MARVRTYIRTGEKGLRPGLYCRGHLALACACSFCGALRLPVGSSSLVSKEREKSLLIPKIVC